ncbi:MAG: TMEM175 family protein, partial [Anaerolineales bacterium]
MSASPLPSENLPTESVVEMARLSGLSDAVFAVALTLLVLDIRLPEGLQTGELLSGLLALAPRLLVYLVSFVIIGGAWGSHQRMLGQIKRGDGPLVWLNLFSLLFVTLLPASAALLGRFPTTFVAVLCFAVDVIMIQLTAWLMWRHASRHNLITPVLDPRVVTGIGRRLSLSGITFTLSIPLALLNTSLVYGIWIALLVLLFTTDWLSWQQAIRTEVASISLPNSAGRGNLQIGLREPVPRIY